MTRIEAARKARVANHILLHWRAVRMPGLVGVWRDRRREYMRLARAAN